MSRSRLRFVQKALGLQVEDYRLTDRHDDDDDDDEEEEVHDDGAQTREKGGHSSHGNVRQVGGDDDDADKVAGGGRGCVKEQKEKDDDEEGEDEEEEEEEEEEEGGDHDQDDEDEDEDGTHSPEDDDEDEDDALHQRIQTLESQTDSILRSRSELRAVIRDHERFLSAISAAETETGPPRIEKRRESELTSLSLEEQHLLRASGTSSACPSEEEEEDGSVESHETGARTVTSTMIFQLENPHIDFTGGGGGGDDDDVVFEELWKSAEVPKKRRWRGRRRITVGEGPERGEATTATTTKTKLPKERGRRASISFERRTSAESAADSRDGDGGGFLTCTANHWRRWRRASNESKASASSSLRQIRQRQPQRQPNDQGSNNEINYKGSNRPKRRFSMEEIQNRNEENEDIETGTQPNNPGLQHRNSDESWNNGLTYKLDAICKRFSWENFHDDRENRGDDDDDHNDDRDEEDDRPRPHNYDSERRAFARRRRSDDDDDDDDDSHSSESYDGDQIRGNPFRRFLDRASIALSGMRNGPPVFFGRGRQHVETDLRATSLMSKATRRGRLHRRPTIESDASERFRYSYRRVGPRYLPGGETFKRCLAVVVVVAIVVVASTLIALDVRRREEGTVRGAAGGDATAPPPPPLTTHNEEELMEIAESINDHCHPSNFHTHRGRFECQTLCRDHLCCFDNVDDPYNCQNDPNKMCAAYVGCQMLVSHLSDEGVLDPEEFPNDDDGGDRYSSNIDDGVLNDDEGGGSYSDFVFTLDDDFQAVQESDANLIEDVLDGYGIEDEVRDDTSTLQNDEAGPTAMQQPNDDNSVNNSPNQSNAHPNTSQSFSPPPPPPYRCTPEGGEDIDWTDPQFQPCRRWEDKYGMTILEYYAEYPTNQQESNAKMPITSGENDLPVQPPTAPSTDSPESTPSPTTDSTFSNLSPEQILQKFQTIAETCNNRVVETDTGRTECANLCDGHMCCFGADDDESNCRRDNPILCQVYDPCKVLLESSSEAEGTFPDPAVGSSGNDESNYEDYLHQVTLDDDDDSLDFYLDDEISFSNFVDDTVAFGDDGYDFDNEDVSLDDVGTSTDGKADNPENAAISAEQYSLAIAIKIGQACNDYSVKTPSGRAECLRMCDGHFCCFEEEGSGLSCRNDESKLCPVYVGCDVLWNDLQSDRDDF